MDSLVQPSAMSQHVTIQQLPVEVLVEFFRLDLLHLRRWASDRYYNAILRLMLVCKAWRALILETPAYWTVIDCSDPAYEKLLARSKNAPLNIFHNDDNERVKVEVIEKLFEHVHRWEAVTLHLDGTSKQSAIVCHALQFATGRSLAELHHVSRGPPSPLRRLQVSGAMGCTTDRFSLGDWTRFAGLRRLALVSIHVVDLTVSQLLEVLRNCPDIETLRVDYSTFQTDPIMARDDPPIIILSKLDNLRLRIWSVYSCQILRSISAPNWTTFECKVWDKGEKPWVPPYSGMVSWERWDPSYVPTRSAFLTQTLVTRLSSTKQAVKVVLSDRAWMTLSFQMIGETNGGNREVYTVDTDSADAGRLYADWLLPLIEAHLDPAIGVTLHVEDGSFDGGPFESLPRILARVVTLQLDRSSAGTLLDRLSCPRVEEGWLCPKLQGLKVVCGHDANAEMVLEMVKARSQARLEWVSKDHSGHPPPEALNWITLKTHPLDESDPPTEMDAATFEAIRSIVGPRATWVDCQNKPRRADLPLDSDPAVFSNY